MNLFLKIFFYSIMTESILFQDLLMIDTCSMEIYIEFDRKINQKFDIESLHVLKDDKQNVLS